MKEIKDKAEQLDIEDKAVLVLAEILFTDEMVQQVKKYRILFLKVSLHLFVLKTILFKSIP